MGVTLQEPRTGPVRGIVARSGVTRCYSLPSCRRCQPSATGISGRHRATVCNRRRPARAWRAADSVRRILVGVLGPAPVETPVPRQEQLARALDLPVNQALTASIPKLAGGGLSAARRLGRVANARLESRVGEGTGDRDARRPRPTHAGATPQPGHLLARMRTGCRRAATGSITPSKASWARRRAMVPSGYSAG